MRDDNPHFQPEIQGLRAVAVLAVLVFHIWPGALPGGYVGVDVFFVVSGYLITSLLLGEIRRTGRVNFTGFYRRRMRRLLPAACATLLIVGALTFTLPPALWRETALEILASALYVQNWYLAWLSVDYLGAENAASPLQHFWSLSIEEQFYLFWPALLALAALMAARSGVSLKTVALGGIGLVFCLSFGASLLFTSDNPQAAYFVSHTRFWELALGAGLAALGRDFGIGGVKGEALAAGGLAAIALSAFLFSDSTAFPGWAALLPTLGAAAILAARAPVGRFSAHGLLSVRPMQWAGDISYSLYLVHWPVIVFYSSWTGRQPGLWDGLALAAACLLLAHLGKVLVEDRFRGPMKRPGRDRTLAAGAAGSLVCGCAALAILAVVQSETSRSAAAVLAENPDYPGALSFTHGFPAPEGAPLLPALAAARTDLPSVYERGCHRGTSRVEPVACVYGLEDSGRRVVLIGDSHAANWAPGLEIVAQRRGWRLEVHTKSSCKFMLAPRTWRDEPYVQCAEWVSRLVEDLTAEPPELVILSQSAGGSIHAPDLSEDAREEGMRRSTLETVDRLRSGGVTIAVLRNNPWMTRNPPRCLSSGEDCSTPANDAFAQEDRLAWAAGELGLPVMDLTAAFCRDGLCPPVIGNVLAWRDEGHLTATFSRTLAEPLNEAFDRAMPEGL